MNDASSAAAVPESLVRLRQRVSARHLSAQWEARMVDIGIEVREHDLRFVELDAFDWPWGTSFSSNAVQAGAVQSRARASKLVADLDLRR